MAETRATTALILTIAAVALVGLVLINDDGEATRESVSSVVNEARAYEVDPETAFIEKGESLNKILKSVTSTEAKSTKAKSTEVQNGVVDDGEDNDITKTNSVGKNRITGDGRNNGKQAKAGFTDADAYTGKDGHYYLGPSRRRIGAGFGRRRRTPETKVVSKSDKKALSKIGLKPSASASASAPAPAPAPAVDVPPPATDQGNQILDKALKSAEASAPSPAPASASASASASAPASASASASAPATASASASASAPAPAPASAPASVGLQSVDHKTLCMHPLGGQPKSNVKLIWHPGCTKESRLMVKFIPAGDGSYYIQSAKNGNCVHPRGGQPNSNVNLIWHPGCKDTDGRLRFIKVKSGDNFYLKSKKSGLCVHPKGGIAKSNMQWLFHAGCSGTRLQFKALDH